MMMMNSGNEGFVAVLNKLLWFIEQMIFSLFWLIL